MAKLTYVRCDICGAVGPEGPGFVSGSYRNPYPSSADMDRRKSIDACAGRASCREAALEIAAQHEAVAQRVEDEDHRRRYG